MRRSMRRPGLRGEIDVLDMTTPVECVDNCYYPYEPDDDAGDILPTLPSTLRAAIYAEDGNWDVLNAAMVQALQGPTPIDLAFTQAWAQKYLTGWKQFVAMNVGGWLLGWEPQAQLDQWIAERVKWARGLEERAKVRLPEVLSSAPPRVSGSEQIGASSAGILTGATGLIVAIAVVAGIVIFGPKFAH